jgi:hypothetical protein
VQISLFAKLKLTKCAPISGLPEIGFLLRPSGSLRLRADAGAPRPRERFIVSGLYFQ